MKLSDLIIIRDYLVHNLRISNIDDTVGYDEGTLLKQINNIAESIDHIDVKIEEKK